MAERKPRRDSSSRLTAGMDGSAVASSTRRGARWLATHAVRVPGGRHPEVEDLRQRGARGHVEHPELAALAIEQGHPERVEADQPADRLRDLLVDALERERRRGEGGHLVDDLEPDRALVQAPDVLEGVAELAREARRQRLPA